MAFRSESKTSSTSPDCRRPAGRSAGPIESPRRTPMSSPISAKPARSSWARRSPRPTPGSTRPITRNPWNLDRTPGGSSSGSAAAVACGMCFGAVGSQTGGSITRPASFCGVAGMKPTRMFVSTTGVFPLAPNLDHVGPIARTVDDLRLMLVGLGESHHDVWKIADRARPLDSPLRLGRLRGFFDRRAEPGRGHRVRRSNSRARRSGSRNRADR